MKTAKTAKTVVFEIVGEKRPQDDKNLVLVYEIDNIRDNRYNAPQVYLSDSEIEIGAEQYHDEGYSVTIFEFDTSNVPENWFI